MTAPLSASLKGILGGLGSSFGGGGVGEQFLIWTVLSTVMQSALAPALSDITQGVNSADSVNPLTPEQLATLVARKFMDADAAATEAAKSGIGTGRFAQLIQLAESPPSLGLIIEAYRRGIIGDGAAESGGLTLQAALADLGLQPQWADTIKELTVVIPDPSQVLLAWLTGQIEAAEAQTRLAQTGMDPTWIQTAYNAEGQAPTPNELLDLWNRGIIVESGTGPASTSYDQGFLEGPWRNKWLDAFKALRLYYPPPRTTQAMLREGTIDIATATTWLSHYGVEGDVLVAFLKQTTHSSSTAARELTEAQVIDLYESKLLTSDEAIADLVDLKLSHADAALLLAYADQKAAASAVKQGVNRLRTLYLNGDDNAATAEANLITLGLTSANAVALVATWNLEKATLVRPLTEAQITSAWYYDIFTQDTAVKRLQALGLSAADALITLSIRNKGPLPGVVIS